MEFIKMSFVKIIILPFVISFNAAQAERMFLHLKGELREDLQTVIDRFKANEELVRTMQEQIVSLVEKNKFQEERIQALEKREKKLKGQIDTMVAGERECNKNLQEMKLSVKQHEERIHNLENRDKDYKKRITALKFKSKEQENNIKILTAYEKEMQDRLIALEYALRHQREEEQTFHDSIETQDFKLNTAGKMPENRTVTNHPYANSYQGYRTAEENEKVLNGRNRRVSTEQPVAFTATIGNHHIPHAGSHQVIVFDNVITNVGGAYNNHVGSFIAPVDGIYVFSVTLFAAPGVGYHGNIVKNGQILTWMLADGQESHAYETASQTVVLELKRGDDVCIQHADVDKTIYGLFHTLFTGFLLDERSSLEAVVGK